MNGNFISDQHFLDRLTEIIKSNLTNAQFGVSELAREMGMSRSNLHLKVKKITKSSASQFINQVRLKKAMEILKKGSLTVSETAYDCGFQSVSYFTKCFREYYGYPPGEAGKHDETEENPVDLQKVNPISYKKWALITVLILAILIPVIAVIYTIFSNRTHASGIPEPEKSIAVLPFKNDSRDTTNAYFINGLMESILSNLSNTPDLNVRSRTSVESYRNTTKSLPEIAKELRVNYVVEGSGQKYGDLVVLNIQLLDANTDRHLFSKQYKREVKEVIDFTRLQNEIALNLVSEVKKTIKPEEVKWYEVISTENFEALNHFFQGAEWHRMAAGNKNQKKMELQARAKFEKALELDSTFILPMIQLGWIYTSLVQLGEVENFDSAFYFANRVLHFDDENAAAYVLLGTLYHYNGNFDEALVNFQKSVQYGSQFGDYITDIGIYRALGSLYLRKDDYLKGFDYFYKQLQLEIDDRQDINYWTLSILHEQFRMLGFFEESNKYSTLILKQNNDSAAYFERLMLTHFTFGNFDSVIKIGEQRGKIDSTNLSWTLPLAYLNLKNNKEAYRWFKYYNYDKRILQPDDQDQIEGLAYILLQNGQKEKADSVFTKAMKTINQKHKTIIFPDFYVPYIRLASVHSALKEKEKAMEYLRSNKITNLFALTILKSSPLFDNIRNEPEFQKIVKDVETKYQKHHEQVGKFLREVGEIE
jgi:TolB-like protein/AraC-like DNA-binding protein